MKVNLKGVKRNAWDGCMEFLIVDNRIVADCELRAMVNYGIAHNCECADDIPNDVVKAILNPLDNTYSQYEDDDTRLISTRRVEYILSYHTSLSQDEIEEIIDLL